MDRAKLLLGLIALCLTASACKKARMRSVPPAAPSATTAADPGPYEPGPYQQAPEVAPGGPPQDPYAPAPRPADPVSVYEEDDRDDSDGELVRPSNYDRRPAPTRSQTCCVARPVPRPTPCCVERRPQPVVERRPQPVVDNHANCPEEVHRYHVQTQVQTQVRAAAPKAPQYSRPEPIAPQLPKSPDPMDNMGRYIELDMTSELYCIWDQPNAKDTELKYDPVRHRVFTRKGRDDSWDRNDNVRAVTGVAPYGNAGFTLVLAGKNNESVVSLIRSGKGTKWDDRGVHYPYEAIYRARSNVPLPRDVVGVCWSDDDPPRSAR